MDEIQAEHWLQKTLQRFRFLGWVLLVLGGCMFAVYLFTLFDSSMVIRVNGVETRDFGTKLGVGAFVGLFPVMGALLAFLPKKTLEPLFRQIFSQVSEIIGSSGSKK